MASSSIQAPVQERIHDATIRLFCASGIQGTSLRKIADEARCSSATVHSLYPTKEKILGGALRQELAHMDHTVPKPSGDTVDDLEEDLVQLARNYARYYRKQPFFYHMVPEITRSPYLRKILLERQEGTMAKLTLLYGHYRDHGVWEPHTQTLSLQEINEEISVAFLGGIFTRVVFGSIGLADKPLEPKRYVRKFLQGWAR